MEIRIDSLENIRAAARQFLASIPPTRRIIAFHAPMGAGKTTFIAALAAELGVTGQEVNSPTFAIVNHYEAAPSAEAQAEAPRDIYHFDLYRLDSREQALDIGAEDLLDSGAWCFVEWPDNCPGLLPDEALDVTITEQPDGSRLLSF